MPYSTKNRYKQGQTLRKEIYMYIVSYIKLVGYAPSITEISEKVDAGRATVWKHINQLVDDGLLRTNHPSTDRAYAPVGYGLRKTNKETK
nr:MAG TPA: LexA repressor [Caudoviricetes sp.]